MSNLNHEEIELLKNETVDNLDLSVWVWHCINRAHIKTIYDLMQYDGQSLMQISMMKEEYVDEIRQKLKSEYGVTLKDEDPDNNAVKKASNALNAQYSKEALFLTDAMLKSHDVIDKVSQLSEDYGIHTLILLDKLPEFAQKSLDNGVRGEEELLADAIDQLEGYIIELADKGMAF